MADQAPREMLGMTEEELSAYLEVLLNEHATEAAADEGTTLSEELDSVGFAAARAAASYAIRLIAANNAYLTRHLLDLGVIPGAVQPTDDTEAEG